VAISLPTITRTTKAAPVTAPRRSRTVADISFPPAGRHGRPARTRTIHQDLSHRHGSRRPDLSRAARLRRSAKESTTDVRRRCGRTSGRRAGAAGPGSLARPAARPGSWRSPPPARQRKTAPARRRTRGVGQGQAEATAPGVGGPCYGHPLSLLNFSCPGHRVAGSGNLLRRGRQDLAAQGRPGLVRTESDPWSTSRTSTASGRQVMRGRYEGGSRRSSPERGHARWNLRRWRRHQSAGVRETLARRPRAGTAASRLVRD